MCLLLYLPDLLQAVMVRVDNFRRLRLILPELLNYLSEQRWQCVLRSIVRPFPLVIDVIPSSSGII